MLRLVAPFAFAAFALAACTSSNEPGSCFRERDGECTEYGPKEGLAGKRLCTGFRWTPGLASCPRENRVGSCTREGGAILEYIYGGPPNRFTPDIAKTHCESAGGTFRP